MHGPTSVAWLLVALSAVVGVFCLVRLCSGRLPAGADLWSEAAEALMGLGMAVMALPGGLGMRVPVALWAVVFGTAGAVALGLAAARARRGGHRGHHLYHVVGMAAMVYMAVAVSGADGGSAMAGMTGMPAEVAGVPAVTGVLLVYFGGYGLWQGVRLLSPTGTGVIAGAGGGSLFFGQQAPAVCRMVMGLAMFAMLLAL